MLNLLSELREKPLVVVSEQNSSAATEMLEAGLATKIAAADAAEIWYVKNEMYALYSQRKTAASVPSAASSASATKEATENVAQPAVN